MRNGGILESWMLFPTVGPYNSIIAKVFGDPRWESGKLIRTSAVDKIEGSKVYTRNTIYRLGAPYETV